MKNTLLLSLSLAALSTLASAATVSCTVTPAGIVTGYSTSTADINGSFVNTGARVTQGGTLASTAVFTCPTITVAAGSTIQNYQVLATGDYTGGPFGTTSGTSVTMGYLVNGGLVSGASQTLIVSGGNSSNNVVPPTPFQLGATQGGVTTANGFTVSLSSQVTAGTVGASTAQVVLSYTVQSGTPEPATLGLVGSALVGLGFLARKRK
jgi:PEP-CTERM motif